MGYRRIQCTGRGSYVISLPKEWVRETGLEKGSQLAFKVQEDTSLLLVPRSVMEGKGKPKREQLKRYQLIVNSKEDVNSLSRKITALYVVGADLIRIIFENEDVAAEYKTMINKLVRNMFLGSEIIDEDSNEITIQILIKHPDFPIEKAIRRMAVLALLANSDAISAFKKMDDKLIQNVVEACNDVNRLDLYVVRQLKYGLERNLFRELGFRTPKEFLGYRIVINNIKSIANNALNLLNNILTFKRLIDDQILFLKEPLDEELYMQILDFNSLAHQLFEESIKALFGRDYNHADRIISKLESTKNLEDDLITLILSKKMDPLVSSILRLILDISRRIMEYSKDIAEVTLNRTIEDIIPSNPK